MPVFRLGQEHAGEERAERHRQTGLVEKQRDAEDQEQREGGKNFTQPRARDMAEHRPRDEVAEHQRADDDRDGEGDALPGKTGPAARVAEQRQRREHRDHRQILEQQDRKRRLPTLRAERAALIQRLQRERSRR